VKRAGILNAALAGGLARLGHTDQVLICDSGMPIAPGAELVDLAFLPGIPGFAEVLDGILGELVVESAMAAVEVVEANPSCAGLLVARFPQAEYVPHEKLKRLSRGARLVVRTGEATPYANVMLRCGVPF
jgi:D-ribose pyranase